MASPRTFLTRELVLRTAISFADQNGINSLSMRKLGQQLGVEAMSLYNHVSNRDDILDGIVEMVVGEFAIPTDDVDWNVALREVARSAREVLLRHPWAPALIQSRVTPSQVRFRYSDALIGTFRRAGFSLEQAYRAELTINSYVYGFSLHEVSWPFDSQRQPEVAASLRPQVYAEEYPYLIEMLSWIMNARIPDAPPQDAGAGESDFLFGLDLILDGLERLRHE